MCQPKVKGGKRCASHHAGTSAMVKLVKLHSGADLDTIRKSFNELNKEGKNLKAPTEAETRQWLETTRLSLKLDNSISSEDKLMILKKIESAIKEGTPSAGAFYAWKQLLNQTQKNMRTVATAGLLVGTLTMTTGCATIEDIGSSISSATGTGLAQLDPNASAPTGDVKLSDSRGSWSQVKLADNNPIFDKKYIVTAVPKDVSTNLTDEEMYDAGVWAVKFVSTEGIDSIAADNSKAWDKWVKEEAPKYLDAKYLKELTAKPKNVDKVIDGTKVDRSLLIMNSQSGSFDGMLIRNSQRVTNMGFDGEIAAVASSANKNAVTVSGTYFATYKVEDEAVKKQIMSQNDLWTEDNLKVSAPKLFDNQPGKGNLRFSFSYTLLKQKDGSWKIAGYDNNYSYESTINQ